jgi:hypothetical protein
MNQTFIFRPPRRKGIGFHALLILVLAGSSAFALFFGLSEQVGGYFVFLLLLSLLLAAPLPLILYRLYALANASYRLERDGLRLRWGLRVEDIPLPEIEWVRYASELPGDLPNPTLSWPGAVLGRVDSQDLGPVEYLASDSGAMLLVATPERVYAISPEQSQDFLQAFQKAFEMGSLTPISSVSVRPAAYLSYVWQDNLARNILLTGLAITLVLFIGVSLAIPGMTSASLGFLPSGEPMPEGPATQLMLLPILGFFIYLVDLTVGLFFYRRDEYRLIAYMVWASGVTALLLLGLATLLILT